MSKHTHTGLCQACGRRHAIRAEKRARKQFGA
jgi:uncharacterized protein YlaI